MAINDEKRKLWKTAKRFNLVNIKNYIHYSSNELKELINIHQYCITDATIQSFVGEDNIRRYVAQI